MSTSAAPVIEQILELTRWAPSGDNTQPWRFELTGDDTLVVHGFDTREHCVYDFEGHPSQISIGAMLETLRIAATGHRMRTEIKRRASAPEDKPAFDVRLLPDDRIESSPLIAAIVERTVQRRPMRLRPLTTAQKSALQASVGPGYSVVWRETLADRLHMARLLFRSARIRLTMPEAYRVHRDVIEFNAKFSADRIPDQAIGLDPVTTRTMQWMMASWSRVKFFNTFLGGTLLPRVELDLIPAVACAGHFVIVRTQPPSSLDDFIEAGGAVQRFWLTATREQLFLQPEMTPLIFGWYTRAEKRFSTLPALWAEAISLVRRWNAFFSEDIARSAIFCGRLGAGPRPKSRSLRLPLSALIKAKP